MSELYERDALFRNYSHSLDETVDNYNWLKTNTREEEFNLILDEIKDIDHQLEKAERTLNWNSSGNNSKNDKLGFLIIFVEFIVYKYRVI